MTHWLYPANIKYFDVFAAFEKRETFWPVNSTVQLGDVVYIYLAAPYKQVAFRADVEEVGLPLDVVLPSVKTFIKGNISSDKENKAFMRLTGIEHFELSETSLLSYGFLKEHGLKGMLMGARKLENCPELLAYIKGVWP